MKIQRYKLACLCCEGVHLIKDDNGEVVFYRSVKRLLKEKDQVITQEGSQTAVLPKEGVCDPNLGVCPIKTIRK
jgi:hypothetical protein